MTSSLTNEIPYVLMVFSKGCLASYQNFGALGRVFSRISQAEPQRPGSSSGHGRFSSKAPERGMRKELRCRNRADRWLVMGVPGP